MRHESGSVMNLHFEELLYISVYIGIRAGASAHRGQVQ